MQEGGLPDSRPREAKARSGYRYRSLFWAIVLIAAGVILLLVNLDVISADNLGVLSLLWPILLVGIGVDLMIGRRSPALGALVGVVTVGLIILFMFLGPSFGWAGNTDLTTETFNTPVGQATSAHVALDLSDYSANVHALQASTAPDRPLLAATVTYRGSIDFQSSGEADKTVRLEPKGRWWWQFLDHGATPWDIGLDPALPLALSVENSSGSADLDLSGLQLTDLGLNMSSGSTQVTLPVGGTQGYKVALDVSSGDTEVKAADGGRFEMSLDMSSGDVQVTLGNDSDVTVSFDGSSGEFTVNLAAGQALRIEVRDVSSGDVNLPSGLVRVDKGDDEEGTWETQGYATAAHKVLVIITSMSSGDVNIRLGS